MASSDVVIVGGGIAGIMTAYFLGKAGVSSTIVERDAVGSHASGFAYGGLSPLSGAGIPGPLAEAAQASMRLHRELAQSLPADTGVNIEFRQRPGLNLLFTEEEVRKARAVLPWQQQQPGYSVQWLQADEAKKVEPRINPDILGGVLMEGMADVEPYRLVLALTRAAENLGAHVRHGHVVGLKRQGARVSGVILENGEIACAHVVLALGPWSEAASAWLNLPIPVRPLKGQILRLQAPGPALQCSVGWASNYATTKPDGLLWTGTTEEEVGFNEHPTTAGRDSIIASLLKMLPALAEARLAQHTACLRPVSQDNLLVVGPVPGYDGVWINTGAGRKGILFAPIMGNIMADLIITGRASIDIKAFAPERFAVTRS